MNTLLSAGESAALPYDAVGWTVTILGVLLVVAWLAYVYR